jgi:hypothetical protein
LRIHLVSRVLGIMIVTQEKWQVIQIIIGEI